MDLGIDALDVFIKLKRQQIMIESLIETIASAFTLCKEQESREKIKKYVYDVIPFDSLYFFSVNTNIENGKVSFNLYLASNADYKMTVTDYAMIMLSEVISIEKRNYYGAFKGEMAQYLSLIGIDDTRAAGNVVNSDDLSKFFEQNIFNADALPVQKHSMCLCFSYKGHSEQELLEIFEYLKDPTLRIAVKATLVSVFNRVKNSKAIELLQQIDTVEKQ